ncbi:MAG: hypothetical protein MUO59_02135 [Actinobacteria bacterium]|nr:hypothetical protein [Actinomycetota bacterium]
MNNEFKKEKTLALSITAKVTGLSGLSLAIILLTVVLVVVFTVLSKNWNIYNTPESVISTSSIILCISGVVCGAIDLKRIKIGKSSGKGRVFDIVGIVSGSIGLAIRFIAMPPIVLTQIIKF